MSYSVGNERRKRTYVVPFVVQEEEVAAGGCQGRVVAQWRDTVIRVRPCRELDSPGQLDGHLGQAWYSDHPAK